MPGKAARALCPVCQEAMPPDETECENCGAFVIDEAVVRLCRAFGIDREKALHLFEKGFRHPKQLAHKDVDEVLSKGENGLLFLCTNCGGFVASGDTTCPRCGAEFEAEPAEAPEERDILDMVLCPVCGADNEPSLKECEICGEPLNGSEEAGPAATAAAPSAAGKAAPEPTLAKVDAFLEDLESSEPEKPPRPGPARPVPAPMKVRPVPKRPIAPRPAKPSPRTEAPREAPTPPTPARLRDAPPRTSSPSAPAPTPRPVPRTAEAPTSVVRVVRRARKSWVAPPPEFTGALVTASAATLALSNLFVSDSAEVGIAWGVAFVLAALSVYSVAAIPSTRNLRLGRSDLGLLAAGVLPAWLCLAIPATLAPALVVLAAIPLALATRRLGKNPARAFLVVAAALGLLGLAVAMALGLELSTTPAWNLGLLAYAPWPGILVGEELRRMRTSARLRRELARAERDIDRREYAESLASYDRAIELSRKGTPGEDLPWYGKGATLILLGRYEEALRAIDTALDINPYNEVAWLNKGNALMKLGQSIDALRCFTAALRVNPRYEVAWNNEGNALARMGRYEEALKCYERALAIDPGYRGSWVNKGYVLTKLGRYDEAASCADRALRLDRRRSEPA